MKWEEWLDRVQVSVTGSQSQKVLWDWQKGTARLSRVTPLLGGFTAWVSRTQYPHLEALCGRYSVEIKQLQTKGPGRFLAPYHARIGLVAGPLLFLAAVHLSGSLVWSVKYIDFTPQQTAFVEEKLLETGLQVGQVATQEKLRQAEQELMSQENAFGWISLNFVDGRLTVECIPAMAEGNFPQSNSWDLVAAVDGVILSQDVSLGFTQNRVGDAVTRGQVLVSSYKLDHDGQPVWQETRGRVVARFSWEYTFFQPLEMTARVEEPGGSSRVEIWAGPFRKTILGKEESGEGRTQYQPVTFLGLTLPATLVTTYYPHYSQETFSLSREGAAQLARYNCLCRLLEEFPGAQILEEYTEQTLEEGVLIYRWKVTAAANIARPSDQPPVVESPVE